MITSPQADQPSKVSFFYDPTLTDYPSVPPFDPSESYPENPSSGHLQSAPNRIYDAVRTTLAQLGLDHEHFDTAQWNPFGELVKPGGSVVIKPNLVDLKQGWIALGGERILDMVAHGSVIRPLVDYAYRAVGASGTIIVGDAPLVHADFEGVVEGAGIRGMMDRLVQRGVPVKLLDFREEFFSRWSGEYSKLPGDPLGNSIIDLGSDSALCPLDTDPPAQYFTLADHSDKRIEPQHHHYRGKHEYCIPNSVLGCDLFINVPKLKSHVKTGITLSLKNLMGITHYRRWMPHHRTGAPPLGDEFPVDPGMILRNRERIIRRIGKLPGGSAFIRAGAYARHLAARAIGHKDQTIIHGGWYGNDTLWRTLVDLNRVLFYGRPGGFIVKEPRAYLSLIDGIIAGEGNGPVKPQTRPAGVIAASCDPVAVDTVLAWIMGFDPKRIRLLQGAAASKSPYRLGCSEWNMLNVISNYQDWKNLNLNFLEPLGWSGYLKRDAQLTPEMVERLKQMGDVKIG
ncbi:MAG: DUF362 domain-containing protein [Calditrichota bacterium]